MGIQRINVVGVPVDVCRPEDLETEILELLAKPGTKQIVFLNIWGLLKARRKNDFAECVKNADLIILDDPVSSFDSNKKYAILHRMFKNMGRQQISLLNKTVLLLTHDFEPITDFIVVGKMSNENAVSSFIWNRGGIVTECNIQPEKDVCIITKEYADIAKNPEVNIVSRIAFLRKLCELNGRQGAWGEAYEIRWCMLRI